MARTAHSNRLIHETSPYLLQHAHNPVDWYPWGEEALDRARREDKPILLSIGYSACHWCHVMERESFEDEDVARLMNELFVCIKVDREERPDLDKVYQTAHQILASRPGGWPLNMFLAPADRMPVFGGTYFPKTSRHGLPAFTDILRQVAAVYRDRRDAIEAQTDTLRETFARIEPADAAPGASPAPELLERGFAELARQYEPRHGGFGAAPKFPHPTALEFLLRHAARAGGAAGREALAMARHTLAAMTRGGLCDQLGGGFFRYCVDERWEIPHFEKMLYDNAQLLGVYADAARAAGDELFRRAALATGAWVMREMRSPAGGYYSTLDADSEGHEGRYYVWSAAEIEELLTPEEWGFVEPHYGLTGAPNFEGRWHLNVRADVATIAERFGRPEAEAGALLASARRKLFAARERRARPGRDDKILTAWNALAIKGLARAGRLLGREDFSASARRAFEFVRAQLWRNGRLLATAKDGRARLNAYLDDYVFLIEAGLELLQTEFRADDLEFITELADIVLERFEDKHHGGFYFTGDDHETLVYRPKPTHDDATPSGNGVAAQALLRLGHLLGEPRYLHAAERTLAGLSAAIAQQPSAYCSLLIALEEYLYPPEIVVLRGAPEALAPWRARLARHYAPRRVALAISNEIEALPGALAGQALHAEVTAYVCAGSACQAPMTDPSELERLLAQNEPAAATPR